MALKNRCLRKKRRGEGDERKMEGPDLFYTESHKTSVFTCKDAPGRKRHTCMHTLPYANIHTITHLQEKPNSCIIDAEYKLTLKHTGSIIFSFLLSTKPHFVLQAVSFFHILFAFCILCWAFSNTISPLIGYHTHNYAIVGANCTNWKCISSICLKQ